MIFDKFLYTLTRTLFSVHGNDLSAWKIFVILFLPFLGYVAGKMLIALFVRKNFFIWRYLGKSSKIIGFVIQLNIFLASISLGFLIGGIDFSLISYFYAVVTYPLFRISSSPVSVLTLGFLALVILFSHFSGKRIIDYLNVKVYPETNIEKGIQHIINLAIKYVLIAFGVVIGFEINGIDLTVFAAIGAALMVGIGFGLQNIANNFVSGIIVLVERPVKIGDFVEIDGISGTVEHIGARSTEIKNGQNNIVIVPNAKIISDNVTNWNSAAEDSLVNIPVGISYESDLDVARSILIEAALEHPLVSKKIEPDVLLVEFADSSVNLSLQVGITLPQKRRKLMSDINFEIARRFKESGIVIPFPQMDISIKKSE